MKRLCLLIILSLCIGNLGLSQNTKYQQVMEKNIYMLDTTSNMDVYLMLFHNFERIAAVEKDKWLPLYYASYCAMSYSAETKDLNVMDRWTDISEELALKADSLSPKNSEIMVLRAATLFIKIQVDMMARGFNYTMRAANLLEKARKIDPKNPRIYVQMGLMKFLTPPQFGGDRVKASEYFQQAEDIFKQTAPQTMEPHWGRMGVKDLLQRCQEFADAAKNK